MLKVVSVICQRNHPNSNGMRRHFTWHRRPCDSEIAHPGISSPESHRRGLQSVGAPLHWLVLRNVQSWLFIAQVGAGLLRGDAQICREISCGWEVVRKRIRSGEALILRIARTKLHSEMSNIFTNAFRFNLNHFIVFPLSRQLISFSATSNRSWQVDR